MIPRVGDRVEVRHDARVLRHLRRVCPDLADLPDLRGSVVDLDPRGTARVLLDPPENYWYLWVAFRDLAPEPPAPAARPPSA